MIKNIDSFVLLKKLEYKSNFEKNKQKRFKKQLKTVNEFNKVDVIYPFGVDKVYSLAESWKKIDWFRYYFVKNLNNLFLKYETIKNNKINLKWLFFLFDSFILKNKNLAKKQHLLKFKQYFFAMLIKNWKINKERGKRWKKFLILERLILWVVARK